MAEKPVRYGDRVEFLYDRDHWSLLRGLRRKALGLMEALKPTGFAPAIHGSVVRGDVDAGSDVDVVILHPAPSHEVELALTRAGYGVYSRSIAQATPGHAPKAHIYLDPEETCSVTFPLLSFRPLEVEFYRFGGMLGYEALAQDLRAPGCTKRLTLIEPTPKGHIESPIRGRELEVARIVGVSLEILEERVRVLTRRDERGRTGLFLDIPVGENETFETVLKRLIDRSPVLRRSYARRRLSPRRA